MNVTLQVNGREMAFSKEELAAIVEKHLATEATRQGNEVKPPTEGEWFEVNPQAIDQSLFQNKREDKDQENTRQLILEAFSVLRSGPRTYGRKFRTMIPKKTWNDKSVAELKQLACELGDHNADWVEQALEWAQRICNGESWKTVCNNTDTANSYRLVVWKNGFARLIGGSRNVYNDSPASVVHNVDHTSNYYLSSTVPLVVLYEE